MRSLLASIVLVSYFSSVLLAQDSLHELRKEVQALTGVVKALQQGMQAQSKRIAVLEEENTRLRAASAAPSSSSGEAVPAPGLTVAGVGAGTRSSGQYLPDIGVVADMLASSTTSGEDTEGNDRLSVREVELVLGHDVDPYSRLDVTLAFSDFESPELEEAYLTHFGLPWGFKTRVGKFKPTIGKVIPLHPDSLETVDEPLMIQEYFGHHGLSKAGMELSNFLPLPWEAVTHELSFGIFEGGVGEEATLLSETRRAPQGSSHLKNFWQINDSNDVELGGSFLLGSADEDTAAEVRAFGADLTYQHYFGTVQKLKLQAEALFQDRSAPTLMAESPSLERGAGGAGDVALFRRHPWGMFALADLRMAPRWSLGSRWDYVEAQALEDSIQNGTQALSGYLTFHQSEWARFRLQYQHLDLESGGTDQRFWLQGTFAIGTHKHQLN